MSRNLILFSFGIIGVFRSQFSAALELTPIEITLEGTGTKAQGTFQVVNTEPQPVAIQARVFLREHDLDGHEKRTPSAEFSVYPPQMRLEPKQSRALKITWRGSQNLPSEKSFRLIVEQLPVEFNKVKINQGLQLQFLMKFVASVYVGPAIGRPVVTVESAILKPGSGSQDQIELILHNEGKRHVILQRIQMLEAKSLLPAKDLEWPAEILAPLEGQNILAGNRRRFILPVNKGFKSLPAKLEVKFD